MSSIAIVGFGRIGRSVVKAGLTGNLFAPDVITDIGDPDILGALFEFDTNYGRFPQPVTVSGDTFQIGDTKATYVNGASGTPDWAALGVEIVVDCTGRATRREGAQAHLDAGASKVVVSAPSKTLDDCDAVILPGINLDSYDPASHHIISMASCTTNALGPVVKVLRDTVGVRDGFFSTVHAYTNTQSLTDQPMKDRRDSWAATENIIPSSSGASNALKFIWPDLKVGGKAYRVPVRTGSIVELNVRAERSTTVEELNTAFIEAAAAGPLKDILGVLHEPWPSARILGESRSSIVDLPLTTVSGDDLVSVAAWYDNEAGYAMRLAETIAKIASS
jgi:glyceraldehyde 3-phosphate dehydrogenase